MAAGREAMVREDRKRSSSVDVEDNFARLASYAT